MQQHFSFIYFSETLQKLTKLYNKNSVNGHSEDLSKESFEKQITDVIDGLHLLFTIKIIIFYV